MPLSFVEDIPKELRLIIYENLFRSTPIVLHPHQHVHGRCLCPHEAQHPAINLFLACRTIYQEATPLFLENTSIDLKDCNFPGVESDVPKHYKINSNELSYDIIDSSIRHLLHLPKAYVRDVPELVFSACGVQMRFCRSMRQWESTIVALHACSSESIATLFQAPAPRVGRSTFELFLETHTPPSYAQHELMRQIWCLAQQESKATGRVGLKLEKNMDVSQEFEVDSERDFLVASEALWPSLHVVLNNTRP